MGLSMIGGDAMTNDGDCVSDRGGGGYSLIEVTIAHGAAGGAAIIIAIV